MKQSLYLEDLHVGQKFTSGTTLVTEEAIKEFAGKYDPQPFHLDDDAAKSTLFGGLAASGWHTAAITMHLNVSSGPPLAGGIVGGGGEIHWPTPTRPGDILRVEGEVKEITPSRSKPDRGMIVMRMETKNQNDEVRQMIVMKLIVPRRPAATA
ncbi:MAG: dehydratase [Rhodospirillales bacterium 20-58-10]|nr:MAG: dehydratase [Rhodospirillales bacterium 20-58-10]